MKIVCGSCQAKYSIADEKVAGKVFKIRCKRCSEVIVVRGDQEEQGAAAQAAAESESSAEAIWHVVINGEQAGPYAPNQLAEMMTAGKLDWEAYVWTEGFENWLPMRDVPDLVTAISGPPSEPQEQVQQQPVRAAVGAPAYTAAQPSMGADPFADEGAGSPGVFASAVAAQPAPAARPNLFVASSAAAESPFEAESRVVASAPSPRVSMEQAMTGARNENSVLFSLKNLQAL
ncbi:MAG TPA: GYF domain-containing protein, partial [Polyangiales bacterium]|nr:GYF domain-containing protein [Polyangiales bacterium]